LPLNTAPTELRDSAFSSPWKNNFAVFRGFPWIKKAVSSHPSST